MSQHELRKLAPRHYRIINLSLLGLTNIEIAKEEGLTPQAIHLIVSSPVFQEEISRRQQSLDRKQDSKELKNLDRARDKLEDAADDAADVQIALLKSDDERVQQKSASEILNRAFGVADQSPRIVVEQANLVLVQQALKESDEARRTKEPQLIESEVIDEH